MKTALICTNPEIILGVSGETIVKNLLFSFQGRINRAKFWLINIAVTIVYSAIAGVLVGGAAMSADPAEALASMGMIGGIVSLVLFIATVWIGLALAVKRWHDRGKSGWWILIAFVPVIGGLWYLIECGFLKGTTGANTYGADPLAA
jgi:uncharacterized membrane protein YhaH (DUF805 family)